MFYQFSVISPESVQIDALVLCQAFGVDVKQCPNMFSGGLLCHCYLLALSVSLFNC